MRITERTPYDEEFAAVEPYLTAAAVEQIKQAAERKFGAMHDLTFAQFCGCLNCDFEPVGDMKNPTVLQVYWCKRFAEYAEQFAKTLKSLQVPPTPEEQQAANGLLKVSWIESALTFLQQWFGLHSYKQAEQITVGELLIAKRAKYIQDMYQRRLSNLQLKKMRKK